MIAIIEREIVDRYRWIDRESFLDLLAVAQSLPGLMAVNISAAVGDKLRGRRGSVIASLGTVLPSFVIILIIAIFLTPDLINNNPLLVKIFKGIRPAVVALIIGAVITTARSSKISLRTVWIPVVVALLIWSKWPVVSNPILWITVGAITGILIMRRSLKNVGRNAAQGDGDSTAS